MRIQYKQNIILNKIFNFKLILHIIKFNYFVSSYLTCEIERMINKVYLIMHQIYKLHMSNS